MFEQNPSENLVLIKTVIDSPRPYGTGNYIEVLKTTRGEAAGRVKAHEKVRDVETQYDDFEREFFVPLKDGKDAWLILKEDDGDEEIKALAKRGFTVINIANPPC